MIAVSSCLLGVNCKYNGDNNKNDKIIDYLKDKEYIIVCPEQLGGLTTPRFPSEIEINNGNDVLEGKSKVISVKGVDVTDNFIKGATEALKIAKMYNVTEAILKESSPSCGVNFIYDGSFTGKKIEGFGVTTALFKNNNISVKSEKEIY